MLRDVFAECRRVLEPGGRIAVNVANLGRKPYRSLSADVVRIVQDDLALLLRGEIVWQKARGATGSIAVGSYLSAANPVLRDVTERVVVASKGRFDRAEPRGAGEAGATVREHDHEGGVLRVDARRVGDPARARPPGRAPGAVPGRAPRTADPALHVRGDVVLDPFLGSGSTAVAAVRATALRRVRHGPGVRRARRRSHRRRTRRLIPADGDRGRRTRRVRLRERRLPRRDLGQASPDRHRAAGIAVVRPCSCTRARRRAP